MSINNLDYDKVYNNKQYYECNGNMQDGRAFTDYRSNCTLNNILISNNNITNTYGYREFLQNNANNIRLNMLKNDQNRCICYGDTMLDEQFMYTCDGELCELSSKNKDGLGVGRNYSING